MIDFRPNADLPRNPDPMFSRFDSAWSQTKTLLEREVSLIGGTAHIVIELAVDPKGIAKDRTWIKERARFYHDGVRVMIDSKHGPLSFDASRYVKWRDNVRSVALTLTALRAVERYGVGTGAEAYRGWTAIEEESARADREMTFAEAHRALTDACSAKWQGLRIMDATAADYQGAYRDAMATFHPDRPGGSHEAAALINRAYDIIKRGLA